MTTITVNNEQVNIFTNETKEQFIEKANNLAKHYEALKEFYAKVFRPVVHQFHGKQANTRFVLALQQGAMDVDENILVGNISNYEDGHSSLTISTTYAGEGYHWLLLSIEQKHFGTEDRSINSAATLRRNKPIYQDSKEQELQDMADGCRDSIEHYDEYMEQVADLKQRIDKYNKVASCFHQHIMRDTLTTY